LVGRRPCGITKSGLLLPFRGRIAVLKGDVVNEETVPTSYAERVGERLRAVRKQKRLSLQAVEATSHQEFKASVLGAYERGERAISVPRLQRLARFYNVPVDQLLPRDLGADPAWGTDDDDIDLRAAEEGNGRRMLDADDRVTIDLTRLEELEAPERDMLSRYLGMIQVQRQDFNGRMLTIRGEDLRAIACLFETSAEGMRRRLSELGVRM
jgi:transcriptional regulator with XRE-family HTH domain